MIKIHQVKSKGDLKKYVSFPNDLFKSNPYFVPELLNSVMQTAKKYGMTHAETGPMLESNLKVQSQWKFFEVRQHRRRRIWKSSL